ncbi:MAG: YlmC/YmxH family sporulation protein [Eubacteriales Family XIII. Incertae Sedis bacterium]|nr:MAG: YlmC/YmxH family sporulation protein [Clostridiales Family XIII bacterium]
MRLSEIGDKEIIDIKDGSKHGQLWDAEMLFDENTGEIKALLVPDFEGAPSRFRKNSDYIKLPWQNILKIGEEIIIFQSVI